MIGQGKVVEQQQLKVGRLYEIEYLKEQPNIDLNEYIKVTLHKGNDEQEELYCRLPTATSQPPTKRSRLSRPTPLPVHEHILKLRSLQQDRLRKLKLLEKNNKDVSLGELTERWKRVCGEVLTDVKNNSVNLRSRDVLRQAGVVDLDEFQFLDLSSEDEEDSCEGSSLLED